MSNDSLSEVLPFSWTVRVVWHISQPIRVGLCFSGKVSTLLSIRNTSEQQNLASYERWKPTFLYILAKDTLCANVLQLIEDEEYWRRRTGLRWRNCDIVVLRKTWKQLYMERNLEAALER